MKICTVFDSMISVFETGKVINTNKFIIRFSNKNISKRNEI